MEASSFRHHMERSHGILLPPIRRVEVRGGGPETYKVSLPRIFKSMEFPVEVCLARANTPGRLRDNFMYQHWKSKVAIMQEGIELLPQCDQCGMHIPAARIFNHRQADKCNKATDIILQRRDVDMAARCGEIELSLEGEEGDKMVEGVATFRYLGRTLEQTNYDWNAVRRNIMRTKLVWGGLGKLLRQER